jgi:hypothetical protein
VKQTTPWLLKPERINFAFCSPSITMQCLNRSAAPVSEQEQPATVRVGLQFLLADPRQAINPLAKIHRLDHPQDPHRGSDLDHGLGLQKLLASATQSTA